VAAAQSDFVVVVAVVAAVAVRFHLSGLALLSSLLSGLQVLQSDLSFHRHHYPPAPD